LYVFLYLGLTTADTFWGDDFYNWVDNKNKKK